MLGVTIIFLGTSKRRTVIDEIVLADIIKEKDAGITITYTEEIFSGDLYIDYELTNDLSEICTDFNCFLFIEVFDEELENYSILGPVIDVTNSSYTGTGTTILPISLTSDRDLELNSLRLRVDVIYGDQEDVLYSSSVN